eukprot:TRINITY_DN5723_c0_g1_i1.p1 TRINITY_DN5723_c0_g1~~TRINITY_DN5723_c0_g1_i1.p1  ORF type:complete len:1217 (-),score=517.40 TRINITY_DN5723_c0_g1_i1:54-3704(-)
MATATPTKSRKQEREKTEISKISRVDLKWKEFEILNDRNSRAFKARWNFGTASRTVILHKHDLPSDRNAVKEFLRVLRSIPPHPHLARVFGSIKKGPNGEKTFFTVDEVVEYSGDFVRNDLESLIEKEITWLNMKETSKILLLWEIVWALWHLHSNGLSHGNLSLQSVLCSSYGIKLSDYSYSFEDKTHSNGTVEKPGPKYDMLLFGRLAISLFDKTANSSEEDPETRVIPFPLTSASDPCLTDVPIGIRTIIFECLQENPEARPSSARCFRTLEDDFLRGKITVSKVSAENLVFGRNIPVLVDEKGDRLGEKDRNIPASLPSQSKEIFKLREQVDRLNTQILEKDRQAKHHAGQQVKMYDSMADLQQQINTLKVQAEHKNVERNESKLEILPQKSLEKTSSSAQLQKSKEEEESLKSDFENKMSLENLQFDLVQQQRDAQLERIQATKSRLLEELEVLKSEQTLMESQHEEKRKEMKNHVEAVKQKQEKEYQDYVAQISEFERQHKEKLLKEENEFNQRVNNSQLESKEKLSKLEVQSDQSNSTSLANTETKVEMQRRLTEEQPLRPVAVSAPALVRANSTLAPPLTAEELEKLEETMRETVEKHQIEDEQLENQHKDLSEQQALFHHQELNKVKQLNEQLTQQFAANYQKDQIALNDQQLIDLRNLQAYFQDPRNHHADPATQEQIQQQYFGQLQQTHQAQIQQFQAKSYAEQQNMNAEKEARLQAATLEQQKNNENLKQRMTRELLELRENHELELKPIRDRMARTPHRSPSFNQQANSVAPVAVSQPAAVEQRAASQSAPVPYPASVPPSAAEQTVPQIQVHQQAAPSVAPVSSLPQENAAQLEENVNAASQPAAQFEMRNSQDEAQRRIPELRPPLSSSPQFGRRAARPMSTSLDPAAVALLQQAQRAQLELLKNQQGPRPNSSLAASSEIEQPLEPVAPAAAPVQSFPVAPVQASFQPPIEEFSQFEDEPVAPVAQPAAQPPQTRFVRAGDAEQQIRSSLDRDLDWNAFRAVLTRILTITDSRDQEMMGEMKHILAPKGVVNRSVWDNFVMWFSPLVPSYAYEPNVIVLDANSPEDLNSNSIPFFTMKDILSIAHQSWFFGFLDPSDTQKILLKHPTGTFLFRFSSQPRCYTLSVSNGGQVGHWRIRSQKTSDSQNFWIDDRQYSSLNEIMQVHMVEPLKVNTAKSTQLPVRLDIPVKREGGGDRVYDDF